MVPLLSPGLIEMPFICLGLSQRFFSSFPLSFLPLKPGVALSLSFLYDRAALLSSAGLPGLASEFVAVTLSVFSLRPVKSASLRKVGTTQLSELKLLDESAARAPRGLKSSSISAPCSSGNSLSLASKCSLLNIAFLFSHFPSSALIFLREDSPGLPSLSSCFVSRSVSFPGALCWMLLPLPFPPLSGPDTYFTSNLLQITSNLEVPTVRKMSSTSPGPAKSKCPESDDPI